MKLSRRSLLRSIPFIGAAILAGSWWFLNQRESNTESQIPTGETTVQSRTMTTSSETATVQTETTGDTVKPFNFQVTWNGDKPTQVNIADYRLIVDGDVSDPLQLTIEDLRRMPSVKKTVNIACVLGWSADVPWEGVLVSYLLDQAGAPKDIDHLTFQSVTGYKTNISGSQLTNPYNMIALKAGDAPLSEAHGYPARLVLPARPGVDWIKYVKRITCTKK
jgi:DMSO/TMAO reductase YedYZ molybdopterin-dependent catalytic subunit